jgi:gas vesicle protein
MKNKIAGLLGLLLLLSVVLACSSINPLSSKGKATPTPTRTSGDNTGDLTVDGETTGVPECDEVMDMIAAEANNPDDGYVVKAIKATFLNRIKDSIKKAVEENKNKNANSTADLAKTCSDFKKQLEKYKADEEKKKNQ